MAILHVAPRWLQDVARPGYAVVDGYPVVQILDWDAQGRPIEILALVVSGTFDTVNHGWRAWGDAQPLDVTWEAGTPKVWSRGRRESVRLEPVDAGRADGGH